MSSCEHTVRIEILGCWRETYSFRVSIADPQVLWWRIFRFQFHQITSKVIEDLESALKHRQTQKLILMEENNQRSNQSSGKDLQAESINYLFTRQYGWQWMDEYLPHCAVAAEFHHETAVWLPVQSVAFEPIPPRRWSQRNRYHRNRLRRWPRLESERVWTCVWRQDSRSVHLQKESFFTGERTEMDTDLPQGFSSVVFNWKILSKLYKLRTSSFSVSNSIQPLKFARVSWSGGWNRTNMGSCQQQTLKKQCFFHAFIYAEGARVSSNIEDGVIGQQVEESLISTRLHRGFGYSLHSLSGFRRHGHLTILKDPATTHKHTHTQRQLIDTGVGLAASAQVTWRCIYTTAGRFWSGLFNSLR